MPSIITHLYFLNSNIIYFGQKQPIKVQIFKISECLGQNLVILHVIIELTGQFLFKFSIILHCHNSPVKFKLIHFLLWIKGPNEIPNFETFVCSGEILPNFSSHFPSHKSIFLFRSNVRKFARKGPIKVQIF